MTDPEGEPDHEEAGSPLRGAGDLARAGLEQARRKASDVIAATRDKSEAVIEDTREKTLRAAAETNRLFQEHPIAAVAAAAAAGAVIGIFVPRLAFGGTVGRLASRAIKTAVASEAAQMLWSGVERAGKAALPARSAVPVALDPPVADDPAATAQAGPKPPR